jgi:hypothetical protein
LEGIGQVAEEFSFEKEKEIARAFLNDSSGK